MIDAQERTAVAIHEAGHAVVSLRFGWPLRYATLRPRAADTAAHVVWADKVPTSTWKAMSVSAAGPLAHDIATGCRDRIRITDGAQGLDSDFEYLREDARTTRDHHRAKGSVIRPGLTRQSTVRRIAEVAWVDAHEMVARDWGAILAVADALLTSRRAVTGRQIRALVAAAPTVAPPSRAHMAADFWPAWFMPRGWWGPQLRTPAAPAGGVQLTVGAAG